MDIIKKTQELVAKRIDINSSEPDTVKYFIVYLLNGEDIVYIGRTSNAQEYLEEKKKKYSFTHYSIDEVDSTAVDNYLAETILSFQPIYNRNIPKNTKYISNNLAKQKYFISKLEFRKIFQEYGGFKYKSSLYIEKKIFDDIYAQEPYHENMPKIGNFINLKVDYNAAPINIHGGHVIDTLYDKEGTEVQALRDFMPNYKEEYKNLNYLEGKEYEVVSLIDSSTFEAIQKSTGIKTVFKAENKSKPWVNNLLGGQWLDAVDECTSSAIRDKYLELIEE